MVLRGKEVYFTFAPSQRAGPSLERMAPVPPPSSCCLSVNKPVAFNSSPLLLQTMGNLHRVTELQMVQPGLNLHVARPLSHALDLPPHWERASAADLGRNAPQVPALSLGPQGSREHRDVHWQDHIQLKRSS